MSVTSGWRPHLPWQPEAGAVVRLGRPIEDWPAGVVARVLAVGPDHVLLQRVDWDIDAGDRRIAPADAMQPARLTGGHGSP